VASTAAGSSRPARAESRSITPPTTRKGIFGRPGIRHSAIAPKPAIWRAFLLPVICLTMSEPMSDSAALRVTTRPVATDSSSAGIWLTRPSPTVSSE
jgi:hypothetical protein